MRNFSVEVIKPAFPTVFAEPKKFFIGAHEQINSNIIPFGVIIALFDDFLEDFVFVWFPFFLQIFLFVDEASSLELQKWLLFVCKCLKKGVPLLDILSKIEYTNSEMRMRSRVLMANRTK